MNPNPYSQFGFMGDAPGASSEEDDRPEQAPVKEKVPTWERDPRFRPSLQDAATRDPRIYPHFSKAQRGVPLAPQGDQLPLGQVNPYGGIGQVTTPTAPLPWGKIVLAGVALGILGGGYYAWTRWGEDGPIAGDEVDEDEDEDLEEDE